MGDTMAMSSTGKSPERPLQIEDYGLIGDMKTAAFVGNNGSIDFMCWPQFDSPSIFCRMLDTSQGGGGHWSIKPRSSTVRKQNYRAKTNILQTKWIDESFVLDLTDFFALSRYSTVLNDDQYLGRGTLVRKLDCVRGSTTVDVDLDPRPGYAMDKGHLVGSKISEKNMSTFKQTLTWQGKTTVPMPTFTIVLVKNEPSKEIPAMFQPGKSHDGRDMAKATFELNDGEHVYMIMCHESIAPKLTPDFVLNIEDDTFKFWTKWIRRCLYRGRFQQEVERSMLILKLLTFDPTGAIVAAPTFSLPEAIGGSRNWDYRYSWVRDSSFTVYVFLKMGFPEEAEAYINFIFARIAEWRQSCAEPSSPTRANTRHLPLMFSIDGHTDLPEKTLPHLSGYLDSSPVRIGNAATDHVQLDIYGELLDSIYLYNKHGKPISYQQWLDIRYLTDFVCTVWDTQDNSIWEVRGQQQNFVYSKMLLWVAVDRSLRLSEKRNFPCPQRQKWMDTRDQIYEEVMTRGFNKEMNCFVQSYESSTILDSAVLIAPLVFFMAPNDPQFVGTLERILKTPEKGGLTSAGFVFRYDHNKTDDGVGGKEGTFVMCTLWLIEALVRAGTYDRKYLDKATTSRSPLPIPCALPG